MARQSKLALAFSVVFLPFLLGASCSTNTVAQSAATSFFNAMATNLVSTLFAAANG